MRGLEIKSLSAECYWVLVTELEFETIERNVGFSEYFSWLQLVVSPY